MGTLRFLGWEPHLSVVEVVSGRDAFTELLIPEGSTGRHVIARVATPEDTASVPRISADLAISSGNVAGWERDFSALNHFKALHGALKPGGILGVIENRAVEGTPFRQMVVSGAVSEEHVIALAEVAGFRLLSRSEVNAQGASPRMTLKFVRP